MQWLAIALGGALGSVLRFAAVGYLTPLLNYRFPFGTFVVNIGDMLERWSNDLFVSTPHRVVNASGRERYSIPMFYDPDFDTAVECLPNCSGPGNPPKYPRTVAGEYITAKYDEAYAYRKKAAS